MKIVSFCNDLLYQDAKPAVTLMLDTQYSKEIRIVFKSGQLMREHTAPYPILVQVLSGSINFGAAGERHSLQAGDLAALDASVPHDLQATTDAVVRLTLNKQDTYERLKEATGQQ
jgi:quercetin dioxygenase-like cupin family protein